MVGEGSDLAGYARRLRRRAYSADQTEFNIFNTDRKLVALQSAIKSLGPCPKRKG